MICPFCKVEVSQETESFAAGVAEMREPMECGHPRACEIINGGDGSNRPGQTYWQECTVCNEITALKAERDKLRDEVTYYANALHLAITRINLASVPKEEA